MRRMQRKKDFPTISRTLTDINKLTSESSDASADKLANVILRDFALTSKLLKLVNSAFYSGMSGEVTLPELPKLPVGDLLRGEIEVAGQLDVA